MFPTNQNTQTPNTTQGATTQTPNIPMTSDLMEALQKQVLGQSGMVSSYNSTLQNNITSLQQAGQNSDTAINSRFDRQVSDLTGKTLNDSTNGRAQGSGGVMNLAALNELTQNTDKTLKDLNDQRQKALLSNDSATAKQVSDMQMQALDFQVKANQQVFSNLLGLGQFGIQQQAEQRAQAAANQSHMEEVMKIAQDNPNAGILSTDTVDQAAQKASMGVDSLSVQQAKANIAKTKQDTLKAANGGNLTSAEKTDKGLMDFQNTFVSGQRMKDGTPILDQNNNITPVAFKSAIASAPSRNVSRSAFIQNFASMLYPDPNNSSNPYAAYGITPKEAKLYIDPNL